ncbi:unnamed protein product [Closterium sp. NIES-53]
MSRRSPFLLIPPHHTDPWQVLKEGLVSLKVPYAYGFSIILLPIIVKLVTFPLTIISMIPRPFPSHHSPWQVLEEGLVSLKVPYAYGFSIILLTIIVKLVLEEGLVSLKLPHSYGFSIILLTIIVKLVTFPLTTVFIMLPPSSPQPPFPPSRSPPTISHSWQVLEEGLVSLKVPYAYGFSIILLTIIVKLVTYPLTKKQVESTLAMQSLTPQLKAIQAQYAGDQERIQMETAKVYQRAGVNPLAG